MPTPKKRPSKAAKAAKKILEESKLLNLKRTTLVEKLKRWWRMGICARFRESSSLTMRRWVPFGRSAPTAGEAVRPPDLTDQKWDHGSTDGDIFVGIRDGVGGPAAMKGLNGRPGVGPTEMWHIVNYVRSLRPAP